MKNKFAILILALLLYSPVPRLASADLGPKPTADIHITLNGQNVPDSSFSAKMLTCQKEQSPLGSKDLIPQLNIREYDSINSCYWMPADLAWGGDCENSNCSFHYFLPSQFRLAIYLPSQDKVFLSAEVARENFKSTFEANLLSNGSIDLKETTPFSQSDIAKNIKQFFFALILTLVLELIVALIFLSVAKISKKILFSVLVANVISLPIVWFVFPLLKIIPIAILLGEIFAFVFEAYFIHLLNKELITLKRSFILSLVMNLTSWIIGGFIFSFLSALFFL